MKKSLTLLLFISSAALADDGAVLKCRALSEAASRLACYDAMPLAAAPAEAFGRENAKKKLHPIAAASDSTIPGELDGWEPNMRITLANGQVWRVIDDSSAVLPRRSNTKVRVERNLFGNLYLSVEGSNRTAKVRRAD